MNIAPTCVAQTRITSTWGEMLLVRTARGLAGVWLKGQAHHPAPFDLPEEARHPWFLATAAALAEWTSRDPASLPPLDPQGTAFQQAVWAQLRAIPRGASRSYGELAALLGKPAASRAVGAAVGRNPISILLPCHRVIGKNGSLTGYAGGLALKQRLLLAEGRLTETLTA
jgi:methylated-DNA-[protein]-cysteine S-methyltransferase